MISRLELLPNEIFLQTFSYLSWNDILISLWALNKRIDSLICSMFSMNERGIIFDKTGLSYKKFSSILRPLLLHSLSLSSSIKYLAFNGINSISIDFIYRRLFYHNDKQTNIFPNLKSLDVIECQLSEPLFQILASLIQYQLDELTLTDIPISSYDLEEHETMHKQLLCQIFSERCQLTSLQLDISKSYYDIYRCLNSYSHRPLHTTSNEFQSYCVTLRHLQIHLEYSCFLEDLIEHVPNLEQLSVQLRRLQRYSMFFHSDIPSAILPNGNWFNQVPKLKCFKLKSSISNDLEFMYLKWLLNNFNHVQKLDLYLYKRHMWETNQTIWKSTLNANFIRQHCLPDQIINLKYFDFYIWVGWKLFFNDVEEIIQSFQMDPFFVDHQWTNAGYFYDEHRPCQHIFSSTPNKFPHSRALSNYPFVQDLLNIRDVKLFIHSSLYSFLKQFDQLCPNTSSITFIPDDDESIDSFKVRTSLITQYRMEQSNQNKIQFLNVTKLRFRTRSTHMTDSIYPLTGYDILLAKIFAHLISMFVHLRHLSMEKLEWLLCITQYASDHLRKDALKTVHFAEFGIESRTRGDRKSVFTSKHLVSVLRTYMPHLQTLCLVRSEDLDWTSMRLHVQPSRSEDPCYPWEQPLETTKSINQHTYVFKKELCQLFKHLKELVYLNIYGDISHQRVRAYYRMVQKHFPKSCVDIQTSRFRLWI